MQQAAAFRDGTGIVIYKDLDKTCASLARFSKQDAETFRRWHTYCEEMRPLLVSLLYNAPMPREQLVDRLSGPKAKELLSHAQHDLFSVVRKHFVDERIRTLFTSYMHVITTENVPGAGIVFPGDLRQYRELHAAGRRRGDAAACARADRRGRRRRDRHRRRRQGHHGHQRPRHRRDSLADGRTINGGKFVASAIDFPTTVQMAGEELFPEPVREKAKAWHWGNHSLVTLHLALKNPPAYRAAAFDPDMSRAYNIFFGMDHIEDVASCFDDCAAKKFPAS